MKIEKRRRPQPEARSNPRKRSENGADLYQSRAPTVNLTPAETLPEATPAKAPTKGHSVRMPAWSSARFVLAAHELRQLPADSGREIAFAGRSNAGKSSAINAITGVSALARISKTPGRTQQLVVFALTDDKRLVDLPGYGYAKVPMALREHWGKTLENYFRSRESLYGLLLAMDIRHPMTEFDRAMIGFATSHGRACHVLLTKADKLKRGQQLNTFRAVTRELEAYGDRCTVQLFSSPERTGVDQARGIIAAWLAA